MGKQFKILLPIIFLLTSVILPQANKWRLAKGTEGINIAAMDVYYSDPDTMYAIGDKFLISTNGGETWDSLCSNFWYNIQKCSDLTDIGALNIDPFDSKIIYVSHYGMDPESNDVHMTTDGGKTWKLLFYGRTAAAPFIETDPIDKHIVYIVQGPEIIHRSSDHFKTWETIDPQEGVMTSFCIAPSNNNILIAGYLSSILKSNDKGKSWVRLPFPIQFFSGITLKIDPLNSDLIYAAVYSHGNQPGGMYKSMDGGINWREINTGLKNTNWLIDNILVNPNNTNQIFIGAASIKNELLFSSNDAGENWILFNKGLPDSGGVSEITIDTVHNKMIICVNDWEESGIYILDSLITQVSDKKTPSESLMLIQNFPNPFNNSTIINYWINENTFIELSIYNVLGQKIKKLIYGEETKGSHKVSFIADDLNSGTYFIQLKSFKNSVTIKAILIR